MRKSTKIIATIGPASDSLETIQKMFDSGMDVARLNFSHGSYEYFDNVISNIRKVSNRIAIMLDTKGPEIRTGELESKSIFLKGGQALYFTSKKILGNKKEITINYNNLEKLKVGNTILIDDGIIETKVIKIEKKRVKVRVLNGGELLPRKTVTIRGHNPNIPFLTKKDKEDIEYGIKKKVDFIAASFVREAKDIIDLQKFLKKKNADGIRIIAKIEHANAIKNVNEIIEVSKGIMVARGDLGVEIPLEKVPNFQKEIISKCNELGRPVIVATQMLESMVNNPRPTRAEVADIAAAIIQGTDAIMLSGETASGKYPLESVKIMNRIAKEYDSQAETNILDNLHSDYVMKNMRVSLYVTKSAYQASKEIDAKAILTPTESGFTARKVSRFKPKCPIYAITHDPRVLRQLQLSWGVYPIIDKKYHDSRDNMINSLVKNLYEKKFVNSKDKLIVTSGHISGRKGHTNIIEIYRVGHILQRCKNKFKTLNL
jgi:pyruvate kinase